MQGTFGSGGEVVFNLRIDTSQANNDVNSLMANFRKLESVAMRYLLIARRMGLPDDVDQALQTISRMMVALRQLDLTLQMTQAAFAASGPIGWVTLATIGAAAAFTALSFYDIGT